MVNVTEKSNFNQNLVERILILEGLDLISSKNIVVDKSTLSIKDLKIVTVFSLDHVQQAIKCCQSIRAHPELTKTKIIAYIFDDMHQDVLHIYNSLCSDVEIRHLKKLFEKYPDYVRKPKEYRFKHIITADTLKVEKLILYVDASISFRNSRGIQFEILINDFLKNNTIDAALFLPTSHSVFSVTHPKMYEFLPADTEKLKHLEMYMAGITLWVSTQKAKNLLHTIVSCGLEQECMAPNGSLQECLPHVT
uniref:Uncharacterized protein n=1 Tax=Acrobeloides nanus TaxID=290746 RepID=A0A914DX99_9BILA